MGLFTKTYTLFRNFQLIHPVHSQIAFTYLLENFEDNFEKKVDGLEELSADVSCEDVGIPGAYGFRVRFRVIPEWKVDRSGTFRENDCAFAEDPRPDGDRGVLLK